MTTVSVTIHEGIALPAADPNGKSDPYCVVVLGAQKKETPVIKKTLNPVWNEKLSFNIDPSRKEKLTITVFDWDRVSEDDLLGHVDLDVQISGARSLRLPLLGKNKNPSGGHLVVSYEWYGPTGSRVFGVAPTGSTPPKFFLQAMDALEHHGTEEEGIFRISGSAKRIQELRELIDFNGNYDLRQENVHDLTGLLKAWLRELPNSLIPFKLFEQIWTERGETTACARLIRECPNSSQGILIPLFHALHKISQNSSKNLMSPENLGIVFAPNLISQPAAAVDAMASNHNTVQQIKQLIEGWPEIAALI